MFILLDILLFPTTLTLAMGKMVMKGLKGFGDMYFTVWNKEMCRTTR